MKKKNCPKCGQGINAHFYYHKDCGWNMKTEPQPEQQPQEQQEVKTEKQKGGITLTKESLKSFFNLRHVLNFKHWGVVLLLIAMLVAGFVRINPYFVPVTDEWANEAINNMYRSQIASKIDASYPDLTSTDRDALIETEFKKIPIKDLTEARAQAKQFFEDQVRFPDGSPYLHDIDTWQHLRRARNVVDHGNMGDSYEGNGAIGGLKDFNGSEIDWDGLRGAPYGTRAYGNVFHVYLLAYTYKFLNIFTNFHLTDVLFLLPVVLSAIAVIPAFFIGKKFGGNIAGFFSALVVGSHPVFVTRTMAGIADTDVYPILFGLFVAWFFLEAMESTELKKRIIWSCMTGLSIGIFTFTWSGWWYIFFLSIGTAGVCSVYSVIKREWKSVGNYALIGGLVIVVAMLTYMVTHGGEIVTMFTEANIFEFIHLKDIATNSLYPNINVTIAEMSAMSFQSIIERFGIAMFWIALIGIPLTVMIKRNGKRDITYAVFLSVWIIATIFASLRGVRFVMMIVPPWGISLGILFGLSIKWLSDLAPKIQIKKNLATGTLLIIACLLVLSPIRESYNATYYQPSPFTDSWYNALDKINQEASVDAIINSWWDFGHWFTAIGNRRVTFDGAHQVGYGAFWVGHALYTPDEDLAVGILRMLDCGANTAEEKLNEYLGYELDGNPKTIDILKQILVFDHTQKGNATEKLKTLAPELSNEQIEDVLQYTHCVPPQNFFVTSSDMIGKASVWGHFGLWDFKKAEIYNSISGKPLNEKIDILESDFDMSEETALKMANEVYDLETNKDVDYPGDHWIAIYPGYLSAPASCVEQKKDNATLLVCGNGPVINKSSWDVSLYDESGKEVKPLLFTFMREGIFYTKPYFENTVDVEVMYVERQDEGRTYLSVGGLAPSMFTRLHYFGGEGLNHFKLFSGQRSIDSTEIFVWMVDWTGKGFYGNGTEIVQVTKEEIGG